MKNKFDKVICLRMGKTTEAKPNRMNLRSPLPRIYYYENKQLQVKGIPVPSTNLQLNLYPNTQLDLWCSDNLSFQCMAPSTWLTNWHTNPSTWLTHQLEKYVGCKVFQFIQTMKIKKLLDYKTLGVKTQQLLQGIWWTRANYVSGHNLHAQWLFIKLYNLASSLTALKIILIYV